ncbi:MAG: SWIM zinc finger family protein [Candidatus Hadarchaeales archaeon]
MVGGMQKKLFDEIVPLLRAGSGITPEVEKKVVELYGDRGKRALEAVKSGKVILRGKRWFVRGKEDEYEVFRTFCTCRDYVLNVATGKTKSDMCYHALAKSICEVLGSGHVIEE